MDWAAIIQKEGQTSSILRADELATKYQVNPIAVTQALARQEQRGLVEHVSRKIYFNSLAPGASHRELVNVLRTHSYISLDTALREYAISTQSPTAITCVTTERPGEFRARTFRIIYRRITKQLHWGFVQKRTRYGNYQIAEPEKALLDSLYLALQQGINPPVDELDFDRVSRGKLLQYASRFPTTVYRLLVEALASRGAA